MSQAYGPERRDTVRFGFGAQGENRPLEFGQTALREQALLEAWKNGCPIAQELTGPNSPYLLEWMINRYRETNGYFKMIRDLASEKRSPVAHFLTRPHMRFYAEDVGKHEPESVPAAHKYQISPMSGYIGYSAPRVAIEVAKKNDRQTAMIAVRDAMERAGDHPSSFLARFSESAIKTYKVDPVEGVLQHIYAKGVLEEQNCQFAYYDLAAQLDAWAPNLWHEYNNLTESDKKRMAIAEVPIPH